MKVLRTVLIGLLFLSPLACGVSQPGSIPLGSPCIKNADCLAGICSDGVCVLGADRACDPEQRRCNGDFIEECRETGDGWTRLEQCEAGCDAGACRSTICSPEETRCEGNLIMQCLGNGSGWTLLQSCSTTCDPTTLSCREQLCTPFETRCDPDSEDVLQTCNSRGSEWSSATCSTENDEAVCAAGRCLPKACTVIKEGDEIVSREQRCRGDVLEACNDTQSGFMAQDLCEFGCAQAGSSASCRQPTCAPGEKRCQEDTLLSCSPQGRSFEFLRFCPSGCEQDGNDAQCTPPSCSAYSRRCGESDDGPIVEQCQADGRKFEALEACAQSCVGGACVLSEAGCTPGEWRCNGREVEQCTRAGNGATQWSYVESCLGGCSGGACDGAGACGCAGGTEAGETCGTQSRSPIQLHALVGDKSPLPADGLSTFLVYSDPIVDSEGRLVPDGTLVTFAHSGPGSLLLSADADPTVPGLQRPTVGGIVKVLLQAPNADGSLTVTASGAKRCEGRITLEFSEDQGSGNASVFVAEDFSTTRNQDRGASTATWDSAAGRVRSTPPYSFGTGADGELTVQARESYDLWSAPERYGYGRDVHSLGKQEAWLAGSFPGLSPGDEVLLIGLSGSTTSAIGVYEFKRVESISGSKVRFTEEVQGLYGPTSNGNLGDQRVVLQRVPNFENVLVLNSGVLTTTPMSAGGSGIVAFRTQGMLRVLGRIHADRTGLPHNQNQSAVSTPSLNRLLHGRGGPGWDGGGIVFLAAKELSVREGGPMSAAKGQISASSREGTSSPDQSTAGGAGTVWIQAGQLDLASSGALAQGRNTYPAGRIRLDYAKIEPGTPTLPAAYVGENGEAQVSSKAVFSVHSPDDDSIVQHRVLGAVGRQGVTPFAGVLPSESGLVFRSRNQSGNWAEIPHAFGGAADPEEFRFQIELKNFSDQALEVQGAAFELKVSTGP